MASKGKSPRFMNIDQYGSPTKRKTSPTMTEMEHGHVGTHFSHLSQSTSALSKPQRPFDMKSLFPFFGGGDGKNDLGNATTQGIFQYAPVTHRDQAMCLLFCFVIIMLAIFGFVGYFVIQLIDKWHSIETLHYHHKMDYDYEQERPPNVNVIEEDPPEPTYSLDSVVRNRLHVGQQGIVREEFKRAVREEAKEEALMDPNPNFNPVKLWGEEPLMITLSKSLLNQTRVGRCSGYIHSQRFAYLPSTSKHLIGKEATEEEDKNTMVIVKQILSVEINLLDPSLAGGIAIQPLASTSSGRIKNKRSGLKSFSSPSDLKLTWPLIQKRGYHCCCTVKLVKEAEALVCKSTETITSVDENIGKAFQLLHKGEFLQAFLNYNAFVDCRVQSLEWTEERKGSTAHSLNDSKDNKEKEKEKDMLLYDKTHFFKIEAQLIYPYVYMNDTLVNTQHLNFSLGDCVVVIH